MEALIVKKSLGIKDFKNILRLKSSKIKNRFEAGLKNVYSYKKESVYLAIIMVTAFVFVYH